MDHFRRWGAAYIVFVLFAVSWIAQAITMSHLSSSEFWAATFENWQSEWLQLTVQAVLLLGLKHIVFRVEAESMERIESKIDTLIKEQTHE